MIRIENPVLGLKIYKSTEEKTAILSGLREDGSIQTFYLYDPDGERHSSAPVALQMRKGLVLALTLSVPLEIIEPQAKVSSLIA